MSNVTVYGMFIHYMSFDMRNNNKNLLNWTESNLQTSNYLVGFIIDYLIISVPDNNSCFINIKFLQSTKTPTYKIKVVQKQLY